MSEDVKPTPEYAIVCQATEVHRLGVCALNQLGYHCYDLELKLISLPHSAQALTKVGQHLRYEAD